MGIWYLIKLSKNEYLGKYNKLFHTCMITDKRENAFYWTTRSIANKVKNSFLDKYPLAKVIKK